MKLSYVEIMEHIGQRGTKTISEAVEDGRLVEVTEQASKFGLPYRIFMTPFVLSKFEARGPDGLEASVFFLVDYLANCTGYDVYGPDDNGDYACVLEPHEEFGHVVLVAEHGRLEAMGLKRTTGDRIEYAM
mgnify:CR=1 FL=1